MFAAPILPSFTPTGWLPAPADQRRLPVPATAGIVEARPLKADWLTPLAIAVDWIAVIVAASVDCLVVPMSATVRWIVERFVVHDRAAAAPNLHRAKPEGFPVWLRALSSTLGVS